MKHGIVGFTLLEMLVVLGIIAIVVGMGTSSYSSAQKKSRDARRKADLNTISAAMEQYYSSCGYAYPTPNAAGFYASVNCENPVITIMPNVPTDPLNVTPYLCQGTCDETSFKICPPVVRSVGVNQYYMETENCSSDDENCCIINQQ